MENMNDPQEPKKEVPETTIQWEIWLNIILFIAMLCAFFHHLVSNKSKDATVEKEVLIEKKVLLTMYGVKKRAFLKWMNLFCYTDTQAFTIYCSKRKVSQSEYDYIIACLGEPSKTMLVQNKGQIINYLKVSYETLRNHVLDNLDEISISKEAYESLSLFPPLIAFRIKEHYQKSAKNTTVHSLR